MKHKFSLVVLLCLQILGAPEQIAASESSSSLDYSMDKREKRLSMALKEIFGVDVAIKGDTLNFIGNKTQLSEAAAKLGDFNQLRQFMIPVKTSTVSTQACLKPNFANWQDCVSAFGIQPSQVSNFAIKAELDRDNRFQIHYDSKFNKTVADAYINELKSCCVYFDWISRNNPKLLEYSDDYLTINYGLLTEHFCTPILTQEPTEITDRFTSSLSLRGVLSKLSAAAGSDISLVATSQPGQYHVRTVMHGNQGSKTQLSTPTIDIVIDRSGSMGGNKINTVNSTMPKLLANLRSALNKGESLSVNVFAFNDHITLHQAYTLTHGSNTFIKWEDIRADGGTDLTHIGNLLRLSHPDKPKVVVGFTDGEHEAISDINLSYKTLKSLQHDGVFAQPYLCQVGQSTPKSTDYFSQISSIFAGSFYNADNIDAFIKTVTSSIPALLESNVPIILTVNGQDVTIRQPDAHADILTTTQVLKKGDSVLHKGVRQTVDVTFPKVVTTAIPTSASGLIGPSAGTPITGSTISTTPSSESKAEKKARLQLEKARLLAELEALDLEDETTQTTSTNQ